LDFQDFNKNGGKLTVMRKDSFCGMAGEFVAAQSSSSAGTQLETQTADAAPRPVFIEAVSMMERRLQPVRRKSAPLAPRGAGFAPRRGEGRGGVGPYVHTHLATSEGFLA
jgi:hypothetical protein